MNNKTKLGFVAPFNVKHVITFLNKDFDKSSREHYPLCQSDKAQSNKERSDEERTQNIDINSSQTSPQPTPQTLTEIE